MSELLDTYGDIPSTHLLGAISNFIDPRDWVNLSKRGGKDGVFLRLAGLLRGISQPLENPVRTSSDKPSPVGLILEYFVLILV